MRSVLSVFVLSVLALASAGASATKPTPMTAAELEGPPAVPAARVAPGQTLEIQVEGLNCALCSEAMRSSLLKASGGRDIEPRLECGRIYVEVPPGATLNEGAVNVTLQANGFNLRGVQKSAKSLGQVRAHKDC